MPAHGVINPGLFIIGGQYQVKDQQMKRVIENGHDDGLRRNMVLNECEQEA